MQPFKLCWIQTGGTLGCHDAQSGRSPSQLSLSQVSSVLENVNVEILCPMTIDSTNLTGTTIEIVMACVQAARTDAVIVTCGTDKLAECAAGLEALNDGRPHVPVCIVGAQHPLTHPGGDGLVNFGSAVRVAREAVQQRLNRVLVTFGRGVYAAHRVLKYSTSSFDAFRGLKLARIETGIQWNRAIRLPAPSVGRGTVRTFCKPDEVVLRVRCPEEPKALAHLCQFDGLKGVILESYGSGNIPDILAPILSEVGRRHPVVITSSVFEGSVENTYMVSALLSSPTCISGGRLLPHTAEMWLRRFLGEGRTIDEIRADFTALQQQV
jgi:L-asparaginase